VVTTRSTLYSALGLCECSEALYNADRVETYLFHGRDRQRTLPESMCNITNGTCYQSSRLSGVR